MHCRCECKLAQPLWKNRKKVLQHSNNRITILLSNTTPGYITKEKETIILKRYLYTHIHIITALFTVVKVWKQPINRWKRKCDTHTHTHTQTLFRLMPVNYGNMDEKESITLSEISKTERQILQSIAYMWNPENKQKTVLNSWREAKRLSRVWLFATPWTLAYQVPSPMGFSRQECWSGLPFPSPGIFPTQESNPGLLHHRQTL